MEKINVYNLEGKKKGFIDKPRIFNIKPRLDIIQIANVVSQSKNKQIQGRDKRAGLRNTAEGWGTGHGVSRLIKVISGDLVIKDLNGLIVFLILINLFLGPGIEPNI
ncbi:unnamed protein product, partial [marine sediment metagenome]